MLILDLLFLNLAGRKSSFHLLCFLYLYSMVSSSGCRDGFLHCTYKFPKNWHRILRMESGWNETRIQAICKHRFELKYCTSSLRSVCIDRHSRTFANSLYERLAYLCDEGREAFRDATACLNDRNYQLGCKMCYSIGRFYREELSEEKRCALALSYVNCFRKAAERFCNGRARQFIEKYNWISASYFVGCARDWLSITMSDQASTTSAYFKTVLTVFALGYFLQSLLL